MNKVKLAIGSAVGAVASFLGLSALAYTTSTVDTIPTELGNTLDTVVQNIIETAINFITNNLPLIVVLGVAVGMTFWLIRKALSAIRGRA